MCVNNPGNVDQLIKVLSFHEAAKINMNIFTLGELSIVVSFKISVILLPDQMLLSQLYGEGSPAYNQITSKCVIWPFIVLLLDICKVWSQNDR